MHHDKNPDRSEIEGAGLSTEILRALHHVGQRLVGLEQAVTNIQAVLQHPQVRKEWYSTAELAELLNVSQYTVQERWCNQGRIECAKDPDTGKWRIPAHEVHRLQAGGAPKAKMK